VVVVPVVLLWLVMSEHAERLIKRATQFAHDVCELVKLLPTRNPGPTVQRQLAKSSTSVAFNYRASCRARSHAEFTAKIGLVAEEADEGRAWLEFMADGKLVSDSRELTCLTQEASELRAIFAASAATARRNRRRKGAARSV
jgi:four helix bundle protein